MSAELLPPLPRPACTYADHSYPAFTKAQMEAYARAAIAGASAAPLTPASVAEAIRTWTDEQRAELFSGSGYCRHCGSADPSCQCWNDE